MSTFMSTNAVQNTTRNNRNRTVHSHIEGNVLSKKRRCYLPLFNKKPAQSGTEALHHKCKAHYLLHLSFSQETARLSEPLHQQHQPPRLIKHTQGGPPSGSRPTRPLTALDLWAFRLRRHKYQATLTQISCCEAILTSCLTAQYLCCEAAQISGDTHTHPRRIQARLLAMFAMAPALQPQRGAGHRSSRRCTSAAGAAFRRRMNAHTHTHTHTPAGP